MHPKSFYHNYHAANEMFPIDKLLIGEIMATGPGSVLDFGCGTGKIIKSITRMVPTVHALGIDMSFLNIIHARAQNNLHSVMIGDEYSLAFLANFDVVFTCSVLCHIEDITKIVEDFKRIALRHIIIAETNDVVGEFYYPHDYESLGFTKLDREWLSTTKATYHIYKYSK